MISQSQVQIVDYKELGVRFKIPTGWTSQIDGDYMFLNNGTIPGIMIVFENRSKSVDELLLRAGNGINQETAQLNSLNDFKETEKNTVEGHYQGIFMGSIVKAYAIGKIDGFGGGISVLALAEPSNFNDILKAEAHKLIASVTFYTAELSEKTIFWKKRLVGKRLKYFNTLTNTDHTGGISTGISDREILDLFNDGSFYYYVNNQSLINAGTIREGENSSGEYRVVTLGDSTYLQLFFKSDSLEFELTLNSRNNTLLNGRRYSLDTIDD